MGEVHKLPDGNLVAYLSHDALQKFENLLNRRNVPGGTVFDSGTLNFLKQKISTSNTIPQWQKDSLLGLIEKGTNPDGAMVISLDSGGRMQLKDRLWTLREELIHGWQYSQGRAWGDHLSQDDFKALHSGMPREMRTHLNTHGYKDFLPHMKVIEAAAKFLATSPEQTMFDNMQRYGYNRMMRLEREGKLPLEGPESVQTLNELKAKVAVFDKKAKAWINEYFEAVDRKHGENAVDKQKHVTTKARKWNEDFLNATIHNTERGSSGKNVGGVETEGAGGAGGGMGGRPPEPPGEPEPEPEPTGRNLWEHIPFDGDWRKLFPPSTSDGVPAVDTPPLEHWQTGPQHPSLPVDNVDRVNKAKGVRHTPEQIEYAKSMIKAYMSVAQGLNPRETEIYKNLRAADDDNWTAGYNNGIIHRIVPSHIHHMWGEDKKKGYAAEAEARSGAFAINATQARHRSWGTAYEGILDGRQLAVHDPTSIIAHDADEIALAAGHRKALEYIKNARILDPEGMPAFVFRGMGSVVPGEDGTPGSILVNPHVVKDIKMTPEEIKSLTDGKLLDTYLRDGRVVDRTVRGHHA